MCKIQGFLSVNLWGQVRTLRGLFLVSRTDGDPPPFSLLSPSLPSVLAVFMYLSSFLKCILTKVVVAWTPLSANQEACALAKCHTQDWRTEHAIRRDLAGISWDLLPEVVDVGGLVDEDAHATKLKGAAPLCVRSSGDVNWRDRERVQHVLKNLSSFRFSTTSTLPSEANEGMF